MQARDELARTRRTTKEVQATVQASKTAVASAKAAADKLSSDTKTVREIDRTARDAVERIGALIGGSSSANTLTGPLIERLNLTVDLMQKFTDRASDVIVKVEPAGPSTGPPSTEPFPNKVRIDKLAASATSSEQLERKLNNISLAATRIQKELSRNKTTDSQMDYINRKLKEFEDSLDDPFNALSELQDKIAARIVTLEQFQPELSTVEKTVQSLLSTVSSDKGRGEKLLSDIDKIFALERLLKSTLGPNGVSSLPKIEAIQVDTSLALRRLDDAVAQIDTRSNQLVEKERRFIREVNERIGRTNQLTIEYNNAISQNQIAAQNLATLESNVLALKNSVEGASGNLIAQPEAQINRLLLMTQELGNSIYRLADKTGLVPINDKQFDVAYVTKDEFESLDVLPKNVGTGIQKFAPVFPRALTEAVYDFYIASINFYTLFNPPLFITDLDNDSTESPRNFILAVVRAAINIGIDIINRTKQVSGEIPVEVRGIFEFLKGQNESIAGENPIASISNLLNANDSVGAYKVTHRILSSLELPIETFFTLMAVGTLARVTVAIGSNVSAIRSRMRLTFNGLIEVNKAANDLRAVVTGAEIPGFTLPSIVKSGQFNEEFLAQIVVSYFRYVKTTVAQLTLIGTEIAVRLGLTFDNGFIQFKAGLRETEELIVRLAEAEVEAISLADALSVIDITGVNLGKEMESLTALIKSRSNLLSNAEKIELGIE